MKNWKYSSFSCYNNLEVINKSIKDFKATLFINNLIINDCDKDYTINKIELDINE